MIFAYKKPGTSIRRVKQDMGAHLKFNEFVKKLHRNKQAKFLKLFNGRNQSIEFFADAFASFLTEAYGREYVSERLILKGLTLCRDLISLQGFRETNENKVSSLLAGFPTIVVIFGCQGRKTLRNRVWGARTLCRALPEPIHIVFSGLHDPKAKRAAIPEESIRMENLFFEGVTRSRSFVNKFVTYNIKVEGESQRTQENINEFLKLRIVEKLNKANVALVTSTFHLPKVARLFEATVKRRSSKINTLLLVGTERLDKVEDTSGDVKYAKQVFFQLFQYLFGELN